MYWTKTIGLIAVLDQHRKWCQSGGRNGTRADLSGADLRGVPVVTGLFGRILARIEANPACLRMSDWHCGTAHCMAGHAVDLAGPDGYALEKATTSDSAGRLIIHASCPWLDEQPDFYASDADALEQIKRLAAKEAAQKEVV